MLAVVHYLKLSHLSADKRCVTLRQHNRGSFTNSVITWSVRIANLPQRLFKHSMAMALKPGFFLMYSRRN